MMNFYLFIYGIFLLSSTIVRIHQDPKVRIAYMEYKPQGIDHPATVVLIHGSPGSGKVFRSLAPLLARHYRVIVPDLPGFGKSRHNIADYSFLTHAHDVDELLGRLKIDKAHLVGFSMGGGVVLSLAQINPSRVLSITMLSAIGLQQREMLGNFYLNHLLYGLQLLVIWPLDNLVPHFGFLDRFELNNSYARNFWDSDQRPLEGILKNFRKPMLIIHGKKDFLVPIQAAFDHAELVPQSKTRFYPQGHFILFTNPADIANDIESFLSGISRNSLN